MAVPWVRFTENALVPKIMLQFQNGDTSWHQGDSAGIFMYSAGIFETFVKKILCPRASPMCTAQWGQKGGQADLGFFEKGFSPENGVASLKPGRGRHTRSGSCSA